MIVRQEWLLYVLLFSSNISEDVDVCEYSLGAFVLDVKTYTVRVKWNLAPELTNAMVESRIIFYSCL